MIRLGLVVLIAILSYRIFSPFEGFMLWGLILAVALYPLHQGLPKRMGGKR